MKRPDHIVAMDHIPGRSWTAFDIDRMREWLVETPQQQLIWIAATRYLGSGATREDIEDAWSAFYTDDFERSRMSYRPGGPDFVTYCVHVCFKRECVRRGMDIRKRRDALVPNTKFSGEERSYEDRIAACNSDPHQKVEQEMLLREIACFFEEGAIPEQQKRAFMLKHYEQMSNEEIAWELRAEPGTVRVWAHRAAVRVQDHLRKKGWLN